jgi:uncharacterized protein (TIGR02270 family)
LPRILEHIVEQHAENAAFLWLLRDRAVNAPHYALRHMARLDEQIEANMDGLRVAGIEGRRIALAQLERHEEPGELFCAAVLALESAESGQIDPLAAVAEAIPDAYRGFLGALGWVTLPVLRPTVRRWLDSPEHFDRQLGIVACSHHRVDPGARLADWLTDRSPTARARALRLVGELGRADLRPLLIAAIAYEADPICRFWAVWSAALIGDLTGLPLLMATAETGGPSSGPALDVAARVAAADETKAWIRRLNCQPAQQRLAVRAAGILGDPAVIPWLIDKMREPELARIAGEGFSLITGVDLAYQDLDRDPPDGFGTGPTEEQSDENVALNLDDHLPWPDPDKVAAWWQSNVARLPPGSRHLLGHRIDTASREQAWAIGYQRQRRAAAYAIAVSRAGANLPNWRTRTRPSTPVAY